MQQRMIENLKIGPCVMRYSIFVPCLYNLDESRKCRALSLAHAAVSLVRLTRLRRQHPALGCYFFFFRAA